MATTIKVSIPSIAKLIDHSLLHPTLTDAQIDAGLAVARAHNVAAACVKPYSIPAALRALEGSDVLVCAVVGFPHGSSTTAVKVAEAREAVAAGAREIDVVVNVGKVLGGQWDYVRDEIRVVNRTVVDTPVGGVGGVPGAGKALLKVIFETDYLADEHIVELCRICSQLGVAFVKTSTGFGFVKRNDGAYSYKGATVPHLKLMKANCSQGVKIKAAGGIRTLDEVLYVASLGVSRIGATATEAILEGARSRGITDTLSEVEVKPIGES